MKRTMLIVGSIVVLVAAAAVALVAFFPKDLVVAELKKQVLAATGRTLTVAGDSSVAFWPALGLSAEDVTLSNPPGFPGAAPFLTARRVVFAVSAAPLLRGEVEVKRLFLDAPELTLVAHRDAPPNWTFTADTSGAAPTQSLKALRLDDVRIVDGALSFTGDEGGAPLILSDIDATLSLAALDAPATVEGSLVYRDETVTLKATAAKARALLEQGATPLAVALESGPLTATLDGDVDLAAGAVRGKLAAQGASLRKVLAWMGSPLPPGPNFAAFSVESGISARLPAIAFTGGAFRLDAIAARGNGEVRVGERGRLAVSGALTIPTLDVNPYLPAPQGQTATAGGGAINAGTSWDATPMDLAGLKAMDADLSLGVGDLRFQKMQFTEAQLRLRMTNGVVDAALSRVRLYGGGGTARLVVDAAGAAPAIRSEIDAAGVEALPLLTAAVGFDKIEGKGRLKASLEGRGRSQADVMRSLGGTMTFAFSDGAWRGVNLAAVARQVQAALTGESVGTASKTDFAEFAADFAVANGVASTSSLRLLNPFVRLDGTGTMDIGAQTTDFRLSPRAVRSMEGQGGDALARGIGVPFRARGPWSRIEFRPDLESVARAQVDRALGGRTVEEALGGLITRNTKNKEKEPSSPLERLLPRN